MLGPGTQVFDISPLISSSIAVFPGDTAFSRKILMDFDRGDHLGLSSIQTTVHLGAHTDAPNHYHREGGDIASRDLSLYMGDCQVVRVRVGQGARIMPADFSATEIRANRVLFRTDSFPDPNRWSEDFNSLSPETVEFLAARNVRLVGIDTPSVDPANDEKLLSHQAIYKNNLAILEGVVLTQVSDGLYTLIALPLKIQGADASPVRAILIRGNP